MLISICINICVTHTATCKDGMIYWSSEHDKDLVNVITYHKHHQYEVNVSLTLYQGMHFCNSANLTTSLVAIYLEDRMNFLLTI